MLQTSMFELIQYAPQTPKVRAIPLLMVPPVINKFYIMDIAPGRSMIEYFVQQGQQVFVDLVAQSASTPPGLGLRHLRRRRSWRRWTRCEKITGTDSTHLLATCSGGILAAMTAAHLAEIGEGDRIAGLTWRSPCWTRPGPASPRRR